MIKGIFALVLLFIVIRIIGLRQITQVGTYDYLIGITIGNITSELILCSNNEIYKPLLGITLCLFMSLLLSSLSMSNSFIRRLIDGKAITLYKDNKIIIQGLKQAKMDINELLSILRIQGYFNLDEIEEITLENSGGISICPKEKYRQVQLDDITKPKPKAPTKIIYIDGYLDKQLLYSLNKDEQWIYSIIKERGYHSLKEIILIILNNDQILIYDK